MQMSKRPVILLAVAFLAGVFAALYGKIIVFGVSFLLFFYLVSIVRSRYGPEKKRQLLHLALMLVFFVMAFGRTASQNAVINSLSDRIMTQSQIKIRGTVYRKEYDSRQKKLYLKNCLIYQKNQTVSCQNVLLYLDSGSYSSGETILISGTILPYQEPRNEGEFNESQYYISQGISFKILGREVIARDQKKDHIAEVLYFLRQKLHETISKGMPDSSADILSAMLLGEPMPSDSTVKVLFQRAGISHILAISGIHISVLGMGVFRLLRKKTGYAAASLCSGSIILAYVCMTGNKTSALRAAIMYVLYLTAQWKGRPYDLLSALSVSVILMLYYRPMLIFSSGFLLSVMAVAAIGTFADIRKKGQAEMPLIHKMLFDVKDTLAGSLWIQLWIIPCLAYYFFEISVYGVALNLLVLPGMGVLLLSGIAGCLLAAVLPQAGTFFLAPASLFLKMLEYIAKTFSKLPGAVWITGKPQMITVIVWYSLLCVLAYFLYKNKQNTNRKRVILSGGICVCFSVILLMPVKLDPEIVFLDVGQGDGIYISTLDQKNIMIDGGSLSKSNVGKYTILPFLKSRCVRKIDYWFISHTDKDHISGFYESVSLGYRVEHVLIARSMMQDAAADELLSFCESNKIEVIKMDAGSIIKTENWSMESLHPKSDITVMDRNAASLVLLFDGMGIKALFPGDLSVKEEYLLLHQAKIMDLNLYKAAHHGSDFSNGAQFMEWISPELTIISCAKNNSYGHPGEDALKRIIKYGGNCMMTMDSGQITVYPDGVAETFLR